MTRPPLTHEGEALAMARPPRIHDRSPLRHRVPIDPLSLAIGAVTGLFGGRVVAALAPATAVPRPGAWIAGGLGGLVAAGLWSALGGAWRTIPAPAHSAGIDLATTLGDAALGAFGGVALALLAGVCMRVRARG
jgi:hypothetical protein